MFKAVDTSRPWPKTGMTSEKWLDVPVLMVRIRDLVFTQEGVYFESILNPGRPYGGDRYPHVVFWNRTMYLEDGHHRAVRAGLEGLDLLQARVLFLEG